MIADQIAESISYIYFTFLQDIIVEYQNIAVVVQSLNVTWGCGGGFVWMVDFFFLVCVCFLKHLGVLKWASVIPSGISGFHSSSYSAVLLAGECMQPST